MNFKAIAIAAAAAAVATSGQAADLPSDIAPVDYVRINDAYGAGFFVLPGTETAIKIGGRVRIDLKINNLTDDEDFGGVDDDGDARNNQNFRARANIRVDTRTQSELGLIRTFADFQFTSDTDGRGNEGVELNAGYVQVGGFTFGRASSTFDLWLGDLSTNTFDRHISDDTVWQASYTYAVANGLTLAASVEDNSDRQHDIIDGTAAGNTVPTFVAKALLNQGWGWAGVSGAVTKLDAVDADSSEIGFGIAGGFGFNLDVIAPGDALNFQVAYADGALAYVGADETADAVLSGGDLEANTAWSVATGYKHNWTSELASGLEASYLDVEAGEETADFNDFNEVVVASSLEYRPVSGLLFSAGAAWKQKDVDGGDKNDAATLNFRVERSF
ncbi:porin [Pseudovibrio sp. Tun.PSC04-5.I4]|uniref:porin n=1 Tax=Pseudovibrio sp. Tun.PSC04-5.I4 TaxID=1798213 RepID=UPI000B8848EE|nr:porin [Pseudovibrio sp. Tun.PSC04-5.I4]